MATLRSLNSQGITILMVTHNPELAAQTNRIIRVKDGLLEN
jgi:putative ABC transport system ATP-binding protein